MNETGKKEGRAQARVLSCNLSGAESQRADSPRNGEWLDFVSFRFRFGSDNVQTRSNLCPILVRAVRHPRRHRGKFVLHFAGANESFHVEK